MCLIFYAQAEEAKKKGNECASEGKYLEALLHYSQAIKLAPKNPTLYSNRSLMLLKVDQYYNGMQDALMAIKLNPTWEKVVVCFVIYDNFVLQMFT